MAGLFAAASFAMATLAGLAHGTLFWPCSRSAPRPPPWSAGMPTSSACRPVRLRLRDGRRQELTVTPGQPGTSADLRPDRL